MAATQTHTVSADLLTLQRRPPVYRVDDKSPRGVTGEGSFVARGVHHKSGVPALVHCDGSSQQALPLAVIGAAILHGVITDAEIDGLRELRGK
jgi:hypothetical protein